jgi:hypothetical protein
MTSLFKTLREWKSHYLLIIMGGIWLSVLVAGFSVLAREEFTPVAEVAQHSMFPSNSQIPLSTKEPTLLLFAHPYCPCTLASLHELDELLRNAQGKVSAIIIFTIPPGMPPGWEEGDSWAFACRIPGVRIARDKGGREARRFGIIGSGHTLLYEPSGKLIFSGGITGSRGHEGDNPGLSSVTSFIFNGHALVSHTPVFGCSLL